MPNKKCPTCGREYNSFAQYCSKCGVALQKAKNTCSECATRFCSGAVFEDDDIFCYYCGALTTFAKERKEQGDILPEVNSDKG